MHERRWVQVREVDLDAARVELVDHGLGDHSGGSVAKSGLVVVGAVTVATGRLSIDGNRSVGGVGGAAVIPNGCAMRWSAPRCRSRRPTRAWICERLGSVLVPTMGGWTAGRC